jgi:hypothetical protein
MCCIKAQEQEHIPVTDLNVLLRNELLVQANAHHVQYPQYAGHFDRYVLVRAVHRIKTKMGVAIEIGDYVLANPTSRTIECGPFIGKKARIIYSFRNKSDTSVPADSVVDCI